MNLALTRTYARALKGQRAYGNRPLRGENLTLIGAISLQGFLGAMTVNSGTSREVFLAFIQQILAAHLKAGVTVVMDNLSTHKAKNIQQVIESFWARVLYWSPYSPDFNPIENCWSKLKEYLRSVAARSRKTLAAALALGLELITSSHINH